MVSGTSQREPPRRCRSLPAVTAERSRRKVIRMWLFSTADGLWLPLGYRCRMSTILAYRVALPCDRRAK
jgi:hypothetical protein